MAHVVELSGFLAVKQFSPVTEDGQRGHALLERDSVAAGETDVCIHESDIDMYQDKISPENGQVRRVMKINVQHLAIGTPVAAKVEQDAFVCARGSLQGRGQIRFGLRRRGINCSHGCLDGARGTYQPYRNSKKLGCLQIRILQDCSQSATNIRQPTILLPVTIASRSMYSVRVVNELRKRLESMVYPDLGAMMEGYAQAAAERGRLEFRQRLDFSAESIDGLDEILVVVGESPELDLEFEVRLWGSYLGEVLRRRYAGGWEMMQYPGAAPAGVTPAGGVAAPAVEVRGSRVFPLIKVFRRLTIGGEEDLRAFFSMVTERLGKPAQIN